MDNRYLSGVLAELNPIFTEQGFKSEKGVYKNESKAIKVEYNNERQSYLLLGANIEDGKIGEFAELSAWLFDDSQKESDAVSVGMDFAETLRAALGIKIQSNRTKSLVELPSASKEGAQKIEGFTKKVLDVYPQYKDEYKAHVTKYGNFLYLNFFSETFVKEIKQTLNEDNKKTKKKLLDLLNFGYFHGDKDTVNTVVACLAAACYKDAELKKKADELLEQNSHFKSSFDNFCPVFAGNNKLKQIFGY